ncbi:histidine kinase [Rhizobium sp. P38BS-XIX]|uniref:sensor histidine kinase n=1 Tax=Rhizobium sp. P38BS-XIX TaxID=2726740 RepID=UPI00145783CF|nr:CHASE3 domain-containing protein [Rhizobium sp. P38BS-XIX]NLR98407.1 histidine kinase [Rhizobium sp. P38BS-XIX]
MKSNAYFFRSTLLALIVGIAVLVVIVGSSLWLVQLNSEYSSRTTELRRLRSFAADLLSTIQDAETGQRGYLLTGDASYLSPYNKAVAELPARRSRLTELVAADSEYAGQLKGLDTAIDLKMAELKTALDYAQQSRMPDAIALVKTNTGEKYMHDIRSLLGTFLATIDRRLVGMVSDQLSAAQNLRWVMICAAFAIGLVLAGAVTIIFQHIRDLSRAREAVQILNTGLEERVNERTQDLMQANQEIQRFAYIVTHDLRAPLVNIMGFLSELENSLKSLRAYVLADENRPNETEIREARLAVEEDLPEAVGFIRSSTQKMDSLINAILKISRDGRRKLQPEQIDLKGLLEATAASVHHQIADTDGKAEISVTVGNFIADRFSLDQIFGNLFDNAVKYQVKGRPLHLRVNAYREGRDRIRVDVRDNGRGIAKQDLDRVFELFRRAGDQDQPGEGIGLAYVRSLIRNLGGDITVESELGTGSIFRLVLPSDLTKIVRSMPA